jgi:hypothetical protein
VTQSQNPPQTAFALRPRRSRLRRFGCTFAVIIWFLILVTPCFCFVLASQGEISVRLGDIPGQSFRIWLLNESRQRGVGISRPTVFSGSAADQICLQTDVSFILWAGSEEATTYCECFAQSTWDAVSSQQGSCAR